MNKKNIWGHTACFGILAVAAAMLMANTAAFAATGPGEKSEEILLEGGDISGIVTDVSSDSITVRVLGRMEGFGFEKELSGNDMQTGLHDGQTPPELPDGQTPPERPEDGQRDGQTPPELPDGQTPPERPEDGMRDGQNPPELPDGQNPPERPEGGQPDGRSESEITVNIVSSTVITKGTDAESADLSDVAVGSMIMISLDGDTAASIMIFG